MVKVVFSTSISSVFLLLLNFGDVLFLACKESLGRLAMKDPSIRSYVGYIWRSLWNGTGKVALWHSLRIQSLKNAAPELEHFLLQMVLLHLPSNPPPNSQTRKNIMTWRRSFCKDRLMFCTFTMALGLRKLTCCSKHALSVCLSLFFVAEEDKSFYPCIDCHGLNDITVISHISYLCFL